MPKAIRNTCFTFLALIVTAFGVHGNKRIAETHKPVANRLAVLADETLLSNVENSFPLTVELSRPVVRLGELQFVTIETRPFTDINVMAIGPNGQIDNDGTFNARADELGKYSFRFKLNDFRQLGSFRLIVKANLAGQQSVAEQSFKLQTWVDDHKEEEFVYPLLP